MVDASSLAGRTLAGRYVVCELIGAGGMGWVFRATDQATSRQVALKVLNPTLMAQDPDVLRRFRHEAKASARIVHPNAVRIIDYGIDGRYAFIAMELLVGRDLAGILAEEAPIDVWRSIHLVAQVCDVLSAAHREGILHRDLKPENVIVSGAPPKERVKVLDFGLAKVYSQRPGGEEFTGTAVNNRVVGTPEYMSPEQCRSEKLDQRSDVYSVGVLFYHLITGRVPFSGVSPVDTMLRQVKEAPYPPSKLVPRLPEAVEKATLKALDKVPAARYQTARHLQQALLRAAQEAGRDTEASEEIAIDLQQTAEEDYPLPAPRASLPSISEEELAIAANVRIALPEATPEFLPAQVPIPLAPAPLPRSALQPAIPEPPVSRAARVPAVVWVLLAALAGSLLMAAVLLLLRK